MEEYGGNSPTGIGICFSAALIKCQGLFFYYLDGIIIIQISIG